MRTVFLGSGGFGVESLRRLASLDDVDLVGVVTAPPRPAGRNQGLTTTPIEHTAHELGIETIQTPERLRSPGSVGDILALEPDLLVLADYGQIVPPELLAGTKVRINEGPFSGLDAIFDVPREALRRCEGDVGR